MLQTPLAKIHISVQTTKRKHRKIYELVKFYVSSTTSLLCVTDVTDRYITFV